MATEFTMCACIGPAYGEEFCYCEMKRRGLPLNEVDRTESKKQLNEKLDKLFGCTKPTSTEQLDKIIDEKYGGYKDNSAE